MSDFFKIIMLFLNFPKFSLKFVLFPCMPPANRFHRDIRMLIGIVLLLALAGFRKAEGHRLYLFGAFEVCGID